ncbi:hypothetical protein FMM68_11095 [Lachnospiraceae bacterium MD329]|nr:hypothetical protein [Lachnospiraceae bacterium MD329]
MSEFKNKGDEAKNNPHNVTAAEVDKNFAAATPANASAPAAAKKPVKEIVIDEAEEKLDNIIKLSRTYRLDGEEIDTIDLSKIEEMNAITMQEADHIYRKITKTPATMPETTYDYAIAVAHILTGYPIEFFRKIGGNDLTKIKLRIVNFLYSED